MKLKNHLLYLTILSLFFLSACSTDDNEDILVSTPKVETQRITGVEVPAATVGGTVISNGGSPILELGICWSTNPTPTINDNKVTINSSYSSFNTNITGLQDSTTYYVRTYARNKKGIGYSNTYTLSTTPITLTLQPGTEGKDAYVNSLYPDVNMGNHVDFNAMAWTSGGNPVVVRSLINFDLSSIPDGTTIKSAKLSLYNNSTSVNNSGKHSEESVYPGTGGENAAYLKRITSSWDESNVTWNNQPTTSSQNQVSLAASTDAHQDYTDIDVTPLIQDIINNRSTSFGIMLMLQTESYYRGLIFASGDNADATKRPKIIIVY